MQMPAQIASDQQAPKATTAMAMVLANRAANSIPTVGTGFVVNQGGVIMVAHHLVRDANQVQVRLSSGEIFDDVQLLGVDARRDIAMLKVPSVALPALDGAFAADLKPDESLTVLAFTGAQPWAAFPGRFVATRMADEVPGAGNGFRILQFLAPKAGGVNSGAGIVDSKGRLVAFAPGALRGGDQPNNAIPLDTVTGLATSPVTRRFSNASGLSPNAVPATAVAALAPAARPVQVASSTQPPATPGAPERSEALAASKDKDFIARNFKTMYIDARNAKYFDAAQLKAQLARNKGFEPLGIAIVEDRNLADTVLEIGYNFAWDFPFSLRHQNSSVILASGKGVGPFSGIAGAADVAKQFVKVLKPYRTPPKKK